ncbi:pseudouridine synthase [Marinospirillum sp.]|uniref:pseudouridine synthase n=1 Tax=Marinospirillum sp. TaxID=2183934 RepID=UPI003A85B02A
MSDLYLFYKPYQVLSQFTDEKGRTTLNDFIRQPGIYPAGRLDYDSEGLLLLTDDGQLQARITHPEFKLPKTYWVQVEGQVTDEALKALSEGVELNDGKTRPARARHLTPPKNLPERSEPVQPRPGLGTSWIEITLIEGRNRQVRRMTAHVGFPTLRLIRWSIGSWSLEKMRPGQLKQTRVHLPTQERKVALKPRKKGVITAGAQPSTPTTRPASSKKSHRRPDHRPK